MSNSQYHQLMDRLFNQHLELEPGEPITVTAEEFRLVEKAAVEHELTLTSTLTEFSKKLKEFSRELGIPWKPYFCGREIKVEESKDRKEEMRDMLSYEISQCPECQAYKRIAALNQNVDLGPDRILEECRKHREALERLDKPSAAPSQVLSPVQWQTIDTAPKDGTPILGFEKRATTILERFTCLWVGKSSTDGRWALIGCGEYSMYPTHWMPLPEGPKG